MSSWTGPGGGGPLKPKPPQTTPTSTLPVSAHGHGDRNRSVSSNPGGINCGAGAPRTPRGPARSRRSRSHDFASGAATQRSGLCGVTITGPRSVTAPTSRHERLCVPRHSPPGTTGPTPARPAIPSSSSSTSSYLENEVFLTHLYQDHLKRPVSPARVCALRDRDWTPGRSRQRGALDPAEPGVPDDPGAQLLHVVLAPVAKPGGAGRRSRGAVGG